MDSIHLFITNNEDNVLQGCKKEKELQQLFRTKRMRHECKKHIHYLYKKSNFLYKRLHAIHGLSDRADSIASYTEFYLSQNLSCADGTEGHYLLGGRNPLPRQTENREREHHR